MPVLVDTNVLIDVLTDDPVWADWSISRLREYAASGLVINPVIYAELCFGSPSPDFVDRIVLRFGLSYRETPRKGLFLAARAFARYKAGKGVRTNVLPDFLVGGHAVATGMAVVTRDIRHFRTYFPDVHVICPL